jgi:hypothetical protein
VPIYLGDLTFQRSSGTIYRITRNTKTPTQKPTNNALVVQSIIASDKDLSFLITEVRGEDIVKKRYHSDMLCGIQ